MEQVNGLVSYMIGITVMKKLNVIWARALSSECKIDKNDFADWMAFLAFLLSIKYLHRG